MTRHTTTRGLPYYEGEDDPSGDLQQEDLARTLEAGFLSVDVGPLSARGPAGTPRRLYVATDGPWAIDNGTTWVTQAATSQVTSHQLTYGGPVDPTWTLGDLAGYVVPVLSGTVRLVGVTVAVLAGTGTVSLTIRRGTSGGTPAAITGLGTTGSPIQVAAGDPPATVLLPAQQIVTLADRDLLTPTIAGVTGVPRGLTIGLLLARSDT